MRAATTVCSSFKVGMVVTWSGLCEDAAQLYGFSTIDMEDVCSQKVYCVYNNIVDSSIDHEPWGEPMWAPNLSDTGKPKDQAIADALEEDIRTGRLLPGDKLPPQRELADLLRINVSTVSRACREVERRGLIGGRRLPNSLPATDCC
jgi:hypothetical protein